jgi:hypothetical protein
VVDALAAGAGLLAASEGHVEAADEPAVLPDGPDLVAAAEVIGCTTVRQSWRNK